MRPGKVVTAALLGAVVAALSGAIGSHARAQDKIVSPLVGGDQATCRSVHIVAEKERVVVDCPADQGYDFCFTRQVVDRAGVLTGRVEFFNDPSKAAKLEHAPGQVLYAGVAKIVTDSGTLEDMEYGVFDTQSKDFAGLATVTGGTGDFAGATGKIATLGNGKGGSLQIGTICTK